MTATLSLKDKTFILLPVSFRRTFSGTVTIFLFLRLKKATPSTPFIVGDTLSVGHGVLYAYLAPLSTGSLLNGVVRLGRRGSTRPRHRPVPRVFFLRQTVSPKSPTLARLRRPVVWPSLIV